MSLANIFGEPGTGVHAYRFLGTAIVDVAATVALAFTGAAYFNYDPIVATVGLLILSLPVHVAFGVKTAWTK